MESRSRRLVIFAVLTILLATPAFAFDVLEGEPVGANDAAVAAAAEKSAWDAGTWRQLGGAKRDFSRGDRAFLKSLSAQEFEALLASPDWLARAAADFRSQAPLVPGDTGEQLVYTPISPCRIVDTTVTGVPFAAGETRSYTIGGVADYSSTGGNAAGCGIPGAEGFILTNERVRAYAFNVVAAGPTGAGNLRAWPADQAPPNASILNYAAVTLLNIANGVIVTNCTDTGLLAIDPLCPGGDVSIRADVAGTHVLIDVQGFFTRLDTELIDADVASVSVDTDVDLSAGTCVEVLACPITSPSGIPGTVVVTAMAEFDVDTNFTFDSGRARISTTSGDCAVGPGSAQFTFSNEEDICCLDTPVSPVRAFSQAEGSTVTYYLNAEMVAAPSALDHLNRADMVCVFHPDGF